MLSRLAESLYWIGRHVERAEDTSRILDVHLALLLDDPWAPEMSSAPRCSRRWATDPDEEAGDDGRRARQPGLGHRATPASVLWLTAARQERTRVACREVVSS